MKKNLQKFSVLAVVSLFLLAATSAFAGTATSSMAVSATIAANCTIASGGTLVFSNYDPLVANLSTPLPATPATISLTCTNGAPATITLGQGSNPAGGSTAAAPLRQMANAGNFLSYALFQDNALTIPWGDTAGTGAAYTGTGIGGNVSVYGLLAAGQNVPMGTYIDTVAITVTF